MTPERFSHLLQLYRNDGLSQPEWEELRTAILEGGFEEYWQKDFAAMWQGVLTEHDVIAAGKRKAVRRVLVRSTAVAAALMGFVLSIWLVKMRQQPDAGDSHRPQVARIAPGNINKAVLLLADGSRIALDSVHNGQIAQQGITRIIKGNGTVSLVAMAGPDEAGLYYNTIMTPRGGQYRVVLPDGSRVWLNSASSLRFPATFQGNERAVELTGEGYFEIEQNPHMPFIVNIRTPSGDGGRVNVLGTHFDIMAYPDEQTINTTLLQGAVAVSKGELVTRLMPGQQAAFDSVNHQLRVKQVDTLQATAWKNGLFEFDNTDLTAIMRQLSRWYDIEIVYRVQPDKAPLGGNISKNLDLADVLALLEASGTNHFKIEGKKVLVLP
ncbi:iron dicitrate transporter FecR [Puia dinghuensis]|uniref:Iron dicitrate transporter FecR n=2 Tax=Puia dinghuensis TaxID=1792502 RepID=A0A8J2UHX4_9BACT|nr:iron dicitrate transporter FecR [Puia dinghuensis]